MNDKELIKKLGGPSKVARELGFLGKRGVCRVCMWQKRGAIPASVKLKHMSYFAAAGAAGFDGFPLSEDSRKERQP